MKRPSESRDAPGARIHPRFSWWSLLVALVVATPNLDGRDGWNGAPSPPAEALEEHDAHPMRAALQGETSRSLTEDDKREIYALLDRFEAALKQRDLVDLWSNIYAPGSDAILKAHQKFFNLTNPRSLTITQRDIRETEGGPVVVFTRNERFEDKQSKQVFGNTFRQTLRLIRVGQEWRLIPMPKD